MASEQRQGATDARPTHQNALLCRRAAVVGLGGAGRLSKVTIAQYVADLGGQVAGRPGRRVVVLRRTYQCRSRPACRQRRQIGPCGSARSRTSPGRRLWRRVVSRAPAEGVHGTLPAGCIVSRLVEIIVLPSSGPSCDRGDPGAKVPLAAGPLCLGRILPPWVPTAALDPVNRCWDRSTFL